MSKVYSEQEQIAQMLTSGLKKNLGLIKDYGVNQDDILELEIAAKQAAAIGKEVDKMRELTREKASEANAKLTIVKSKIHDIKLIIKRNFEQSRWQDFGISDKR